MKQTNKQSFGYLIYQTSGGLWVLDLRAGDLRVKRGFQRYIEALQVVESLALHLNAEDQNGTRFKQNSRRAA
jgi:hypothetical protein